MNGRLDGWKFKVGLVWRINRERLVLKVVSRCCWSLLLEEAELIDAGGLVGLEQVCGHGVVVGFEGQPQFLLTS